MKPIPEDPLKFHVSCSVHDNMAILDVTHECCCPTVDFFGKNVWTAVNHQKAHDIPPLSLDHTQEWQNVSIFGQKDACLEGNF